MNSPPAKNMTMSIREVDIYDPGQIEVTAPELSFVIPVYGSPDSLEPLCHRITTVCRSIGKACEIILVDDRCPLGSWEVIKRLAEVDSAIVGIRFSRNFGQHAAINSGLLVARGQWIVVMDCDLQDQPEEVPAMLEAANAGSFDIVRARRGERRDALHRKLMSKAFYATLGFLTSTHQSAEVANFGVYSRRVIEAINSWQEESKYFPATVEWIGFASSSVLVSHGARHSGKSSYRFRNLFKLGLNVVVGFSDRPLKILMLAGFLISILSFGLAVLVLILGLLGVFSQPGWASIILSLWFIAGTLLFGIGLTGIYVGRILIEAKGRPTFVIDTIIRNPTSD